MEVSPKIGAGLIITIGGLLFAAGGWKARVDVQIENMPKIEAVAKAYEIEISQLRQEVEDLKKNQRQ